VLINCGSVDQVRAGNPSGQFFDGAQWHTVHPQLDRILVKRKSGSDIQTEIIILRQRVSSVAELDSVAQQMKMAQADIVELGGYVRLSDQPQRLTNVIAIKLAADRELKPLLDSYQLRLKERPSYSSDIVICEAVGTSLFASLIAAAALQQEVGVIYAMPQIEQLRVRK
jgi:hypothetical protein